MASCESNNCMDAHCHRGSPGISHPSFSTWERKESSRFPAEAPRREGLRDESSEPSAPVAPGSGTACWREAGKPVSPGASCAEHQGGRLSTRAPGQAAVRAGGSEPRPPNAARPSARRHPPPKAAAAGQGLPAGHHLPRPVGPIHLVAPPPSPQPF